MTKVFFVLVLTCLAAEAQLKKVCFTVDDLPVVAYGDEQAEFCEMVTRGLLAGFRKHQVPAVGFVNEFKLFDQEMEMIDHQKRCLELWLGAGMELGNHSFRHSDFNTTDFGTYTAEILLGEKVTRRLAGQYGLPYRYFRHPYLHMGERKGKADSLSGFLLKHGYITAPVTIDNDDYLFARAYHMSKKAGNEKMAKKIVEDYLDYMEQKLVYFENQSLNLFGRPINQILLLHASWLNATCADALAALYKKHGYAFIGLEEALKDEAYTSEISRFGKFGISWIDRWALSAGKTGDFFKGDPETPAYIQNFGK